MLLQWMQSFDNKLLHQLDFQDEQLVIVRTSNVVSSSHGRADSVSFIYGIVFVNIFTAWVL